MISDTYLENLTSFPDVDVVILGDLDQQRAQAQAEKYDVPQWGIAATTSSTHPDVEIVVNLTIPAVHAEVASQAIAAGKHVWSEKPISVDRASGRALLDQAEAAGLLVGVAPDTVLGPGVQTARRAIARGDIGVPLSAQTVMQYTGPGHLPPQPGVPVRQGRRPAVRHRPVLHHHARPRLRTGATRRRRGLEGPRDPDRPGRRPYRAPSSPSRSPPTSPAIAQFEDGGVSQSVFSFQSPLARMGIVEITGTEGTLVVPDPNMFTGEVKITRAAGLRRDRRGSAVGDRADHRALSRTGHRGAGHGAIIRTGTRHLASGELGYHVLDTLVSIDNAMAENRIVEVESPVHRVPLVAEDFDPFQATL